MPSPLLRRLTSALAIACAAVFAAAGPAQAARVFTVNSTLDAPDASSTRGQCLTPSSVCTLRVAIQLANATPNLADGPDQIVFALGQTAQITLGAQLPEITTDMDIRGPGARSLTLSGNAAGQERVLSIGRNAHVVLAGLTIAHGSADLGGGIYNVGAKLTINDCDILENKARVGGGVYNLGPLSVARSTFGSNVATATSDTGASAGGGLYSTGQFAVEIRDSTFDRNSASSGGGIYAAVSHVDVSGSAFTRNAALGQGGAIANLWGTIDLANSTLVGNAAAFGAGGAIHNAGTLHAYDSTIAGNSASSGGGIFTTDNTRIGGTLVARNSAPNGPDMTSRWDDQITSVGGNLIGNGKDLSLAAFAHAVDQIGTAAAPIDPRLELDASGQPLLRNAGGLPATVALLAGSPAIDRGGDFSRQVPETDQRGAGYARRRGARVDVGAFETQAPANTAPAAQTSPEDAPLVFSAVAGTAISVSDIGYPASRVATTTLSLPAGTGALAPGSTPSGVAVSGAGTGSLTLVGPMSAITQALDGLTLTPPVDYDGQPTLAITTRDSDGATATSRIAISVYEVNDAPVAADDALADMAGCRVIAFADLLGNDVAGPANEARQTLKVTAVGDATGGSVELTPAGVLFTADPDAKGKASFAYTVSDTGTTDGTRDPRSAGAYATFELTPSDTAEPCTGR